MFSTVDFTGLASTDQILFHANWTTAVDGGESFWLRSVTVPSPIVGAGLPGLITACFGMLGLRTWRRRRELGA
jgi:hypothetical protein